MPLEASSSDMRMNTILIAEDEPEVRDYLGVALNCEGYGVEFAQNGEEVMSVLENRGTDVSLLLLDLIMPRKDGFETLREVRQGWPGLPVITLSGSCTPANVATVLKAGALDFLSKPIGHDDLLRAIQGALNTPKISRGPMTAAHARSTVHSAAPEGTWSERVNALLDRVAGADVPVLLRGETGVGKEVLARKLHAQSRRAGRPFLKLNCAALPSELVESELFGYERGAFTGAFKNTPGKFEMANSGTILLDEIGDMDFKLQAKLLQVLQDKEFSRLGAKDTCRVDVRVMAATHCDLEKAMRDGRFREDLFYRLNIIEVHIPALRERKDEIVSLSEHFLRKYAPHDDVDIPPRLKQALLDHDWPGNVRELENVIRRFLVFRSVDVVVNELSRRRNHARPLSASAAPEKANALPAMAISDVEEPAAAAVAFAPSVPAPRRPEANGHASHSSARSNCTAASASSLADVDQARKKAETEAIVSALNSTLWNRKQAARLLMIDYKALLYKMKKLGIGEKSSAEADSEARPLD